MIRLNIEYFVSTYVISSYTCQFVADPYFWVNSFVVVAETKVTILQLRPVYNGIGRSGSYELSRILLKRGFWLYLCGTYNSLAIKFNAGNAPSIPLCSIILYVRSHHLKVCKNYWKKCLIIAYK